MKYGSSFLWHLGEAWHFDGRGWPAERTLCIAGLSDIYLAGPTSSGSYWDGLVHAWSASLGGNVPVRYVNRSHSSTVIYAKALELCSCTDGEKDAVFCLMRDFLADGSLPQSLTPTYGGREVHVVAFRAGPRCVEQCPFRILVVGIRGELHDQRNKSQQPRNVLRKWSGVRLWRRNIADIWQHPHGRRPQNLVLASKQGDFLYRRAADSS